MKKIRYIIYLLLMFFLFGYRVNAQATLNVSTSSVAPGQSFTASVSMYNAAAWSIHVNASGPVSGCSINVADASADALNTSNTFTTTCTATGTGTITISLSGDTTDQNGNTSYLSGSRSVTVATQTTVTPSNPTTPSTPSKPNTPSNPKTADTRSNDNYLKSLKVDGFELNKTGDTTYTLSVKNSVDHITIKAEKNNAKSSVTGVGNVSLKVGENKFNVVVTAENGAQRTYTITVTRRDSFFPLTDLKQAIADSDSDEVMIVLNGGETLKQSDMEQMRKSKKIFNFIKYGEDKKVLYSWIIDGNKIKEAVDLPLDVQFDSVDMETIKKETNYAEGFFFSVKDGKYPDDTKLKFFVGDMYDNDIKLNKHLFSNGHRWLVVGTGKVEDGYISVLINKGGDVLLSRAEYLNGDKKAFNIFIPICIVEALIICLLLIILKGKKGNKNKENEDTPEIISTTSIDNENMNITMDTTPATTPQFPLDPQ